jgi:Xaa-Pro aminopeptidase
MDKRLNNAREYLKGLDAIVLYSRPNVTYASGYKGSDAVMVYTDSEAFLYVDSRNTLQAKEESATQVFEIKKRWEEIYDHLQSLGIKTLGIESNVIDVDSFIQMKDLFKGIEITPLGKQLRYLRSLKDPDEIALLEKAASISEEALTRVFESGIIGRREVDVAFELEYEMRRLGASASSFELIVASGPRSAMPHGSATDRIIRSDEPVVIDFGSVYKGYCSDQTVTVYTGRAAPDFANAYEMVRKAQKRSVEALSSGVKAVNIDKLARGYLDSVGLGKYFGHGLGHGVGMEVHEMPTLSPSSDDVLEETMVVTIEPGVYLPGRFGIRLEDMFMITDNSCQRITNLDKDAIQVIN